MIIACFFMALVLACAKKEKPESETPVSLETGEHVYKKYCILCHGSDGKLGVNGAKDLTISKLTLDERIIQINNGKNAMTPFKGILDPGEIKSVAMYTMNLK
jgi:mono/diheme cytochrome c family protein